MQRLFDYKNKKGFTLIEMLIVILIIVIIMSIAVPSILAYRKEAERTSDLGEAKTVLTAVETALVNNTIDRSAWLFGLDRDTDGDAVSDECYSRSVITPATNTASGFLGTLSELLGGEKFSGVFKFGYDLNDNSVNWVSYHKYTTSELEASTHASAEPSEVMVYDVKNDVSGYLDELDETIYTEAIYGH